jgi:hypothetical protein
MSKKKKKKRKSKKVDLSLALSIIAILISIFSLPMVNKYFDKAKIEIIDLGITKFKNKDLIRKEYLLVNNSGNTAKNIKLRFKILQGDWVWFQKKGFFNKIATDSIGGAIAKEYIYETDQFASNQSIYIKIYSSYSEYKKTNNLDSLVLNEPFLKPDTYYGPYIAEVIHSDGVETPRHKRYLELKEIND